MKHKGLIALFLIGLMIVVFPHVAQIVHQYLQTEQVIELQAEWEELSDVQKEKYIEKVDACNQSVYQDIENLHDPFTKNQEKLEVFQDCLGMEDDMFAAIEIPKLNLVIPIYLGTSEENLSKGIGQVEGSSLPLGGIGTHSVLAGHRGMGTKAMFRNVDELSNGDTIYIHIINQTLVYQVYDQSIIYPNDPSNLEIQEGKDLVTLLTCHPYRHDYQRLLVHAERLS